MRLSSILALLLISSASAQPFVYVRKQLSDNTVLSVSTGWSDTTTSRMGVPPAGSTWQAIPISNYKATSVSDPMDGVAVHRVIGNQVFDRSAVIVALERLSVRRRAATGRLGDLLAKLQSLQSLAPTTPTTEYLSHIADLQALISTAKSEAGIQ